MKIALWILPFLAVACTATQGRPAKVTTKGEARRCLDAIDHPSRQIIRCDDVYAHPEFYTETERIRCEYAVSPEPR